MAVASDEDLPRLKLPLLPLGDPAMIADFILCYDGCCRMAQLSDDCFAFGGALLSVDQALARISERVVAVVDAETVPLRAAAGRVLAEDLVAAINLPPHANSAVDGYAVRHADLSDDRETELPIGGRAAAGHPLGRAIRPGEAVRIFTGAPMPSGADTVMMQEDCVAIRWPGAAQARDPQRR